MLKNYELPDKKTFIIFLTIPLSLTCIYYFAEPLQLMSIFKDFDLIKMDELYNGLFVLNKRSNLYNLIHWIIGVDIFYLIIPVLLVSFVFNEKLSTFAFRLKTNKQELKIYMLFMLIMLPLVLFFSGTGSFQERYPFYQLSSQNTDWQGFYLWELFYLTHFIAVEFFFRGFMLHGLKEKLGVYSIFVMTIPYCMIHFGKPFPETIAAIIAGITLGYLSLKGNSILIGCMLHISVALCMDVASLWRQGFI